MRQNGLGGFQQTNHIRIKLTADAVHRKCFERAICTIARIVQQHVDLAKLFDPLCDGSFNRTRVRNVEARDKNVVVSNKVYFILRGAHCRHDLPAS